jgi:hypothetical protein
LIRNIWKFIKVKIDFRELFLAFILWMAFATFGLFPNLSTIVGKYLGFELGINFLLVSAVLFLLFSTFRQHLENEKTNNTITKLVRHLAIRDFKEENKL